jgi:hypothetical protein
MDDCYQVPGSARLDKACKERAKSTAQALPILCQGRSGGARCGDDRYKEAEAAMLVYCLCSVCILFVCSVQNSLKFFTGLVSRRGVSVESWWL